MVTVADVQAARARIGDSVLRTPLLPADSLAPGLWLKAESLQRMGSFKVRGAFSRMRLLTAEERHRGVVAASAGNHAQGVALVARELGIAATIVMPEGAPLTKLEATRRLGAEVIQEGTTFDAAFARAEALASERGHVLIHAFDDDGVIAGQGTVALEILEDLPDCACILVPIGGGGLIAGIAAAAKGLRPDVQIIGVEAAGAAAMAESLRAGHLVALPSVHTIADGLAVKQPSLRTFDMVRALVDDVVVVQEDDVARAMLLLIERVRLVAEGAGAAATAAALTRAWPQPTVAIVSGGNVDVTMLGEIIDRGLVHEGRYVRLRTMVPDRPGGLATLLHLVALEGGNLITVDHDRLRIGLPLDETWVTLLVEARGPEHAQAVRDRLVREGYTLTDG
ncbi:MAG TPA: threonine ammonia-lyase [Bacillota bacterium]|nr:threonine ammonia-lyase [Bacillota bacterium]